MKKKNWLFLILFAFFGLLSFLAVSVDLNPRQVLGLDDGWQTTDTIQVVIAFVFFVATFVFYGLAIKTWDGSGKGVTK